MVDLWGGSIYIYIIQNNALIWWNPHCQQRLKVGTGGGVAYIYICIYLVDILSYTFCVFRLCLQFCVCLGRFAFRLQRCLTVSGIILSSLKAHTPPQLAILDNCKNNEQKQRPATTLLNETQSTTHAKKRFRTSMSA